MIPPPRPRFETRPSHMGFVVYKVPLRQVPLPVFRLSPVSTVPAMLHTHPHINTAHMRRTSGRNLEILKQRNALSDAKYWSGGHFHAVLSSRLQTYRQTYFENILEQNAQVLRDALPVNVGEPIKVPSLSLGNSDNKGTMDNKKHHKIHCVMDFCNVLQDTADRASTRQTFVADRPSVRSSCKTFSWHWDSGTEAEN